MCSRGTHTARDVLLRMVMLGTTLTYGSRLPYLEREQVPASIQAIYDHLHSTCGHVSCTYKVMAYHAASLPSFLQWQEALKTGALDMQLRQLACVQVSQLNGCRYCAAHAISIGLAHGVSPEKFTALPVYITSPLFTDTERLVVGYATEMTRRVQTDRILANELERRLGQEAFVQLTLSAARRSTSRSAQSSTPTDGRAVVGHSGPRRATARGESISATRPSAPAWNPRSGYAVPCAISYSNSPHKSGCGCPRPGSGLANENPLVTSL